MGAGALAAAKALLPLALDPGVLAWAQAQSDLGGPAAGAGLGAGAFAGTTLLVEDEELELELDEEEELDELPDSTPLLPLALVV